MAIPRRRPQPGLGARGMRRLVLTTIGATLIAWGSQGCGTETPSPPAATNPLDPAVEGDPFRLEAAVSGLGVTLTWELPEGPRIDEVRVLRRRDLRGSYSAVSPPLTRRVDSWVDPNIHNGHTYEYKITAFDPLGRAASHSQIRSVRINMDPILTAAGEFPATPSDSIPIHILAAGARDVRLAVGPDPTGAPWQTMSDELVIELPRQSELYTLSAQVRYTDETISPVVTDSIILDQTRPLPAFNLEVAQPDQRRIAVDASSSIDSLDLCPSDSLLFAWDWGDSTFSDTGRVAAAVHTYPGPGPWSVTLHVTDWVGWTDSLRLDTPRLNRPPAAPGDPLPADGSEDRTNEQVLSWAEVTDPENDKVGYHVDFGIEEPTRRVARAIENTHIEISGLERGTLYAWRVTALDEYADSTAGPVWTFRTLDNRAPTPPALPAPSDGAAELPRIVTLEWRRSQDLDGDPVRYDVYMGRDEPDAPVAEELVLPRLQIEELAYDAQYRWRVFAYDDHGGATAGPVWSFHTASSRPPSAPSGAEPPDGAVNVRVDPVLSWDPSTDANLDGIVYHVDFGRNEPWERIAVNLQSTELAIHGLEFGTAYVWRVTAEDQSGASTAGPVWTFLTGQETPPETPGTPDPPAGAEEVTPWAYLSWQESIDPEGSAVVYDVRLGPSQTPPLVAADLEAAWYVPAELQPHTRYYWKVTACDGDGLEAPGPLWNFRTGPEPVFAMEFVTVPSDSFRMGIWDDPCNYDERWTTLTHDIAVGQYEVTNEQYAHVLRWAMENGLAEARSGYVILTAYWYDPWVPLLRINRDDSEIFSLDGRTGVDPSKIQHPVDDLTWYGAAIYCNWLSTMEGLSPAYDIFEWFCNGDEPYSAAGYRLPTDAEWERAAAAGGGHYPWGNGAPTCLRANYGACQLGDTQPVGSYPGGPSYGGRPLYDLAGNAWEWCNDRFRCEVYPEEPIDPHGPLEGTVRLLRGGGWNSDPVSLSTSTRTGRSPDDTPYAHGMRVVRTINP
ncbi:MAG: SUMF1/EgtB/PvdO family nonheme iron enzyme [Candidatus Eisenbacteria bacterium]|nr:SUMF1/EgtB/PvdO family nonheme iron enzyme [Candidatus Eisenbacteria bacterium]